MKISLVGDRWSYKENIRYIFKVLNGLKNGCGMISFKYVRVMPCEKCMSLRGVSKGWVFWKIRRDGFVFYQKSKAIIMMGL